MNADLIGTIGDSFEWGTEYIFEASYINGHGLPIYYQYKFEVPEKEGGISATILFTLESL